jgi:hypothetical protein
MPAVERQADKPIQAKELLIPPPKVEEKPLEPPKWFYLVTGQGRVLSAFATNAESARAAIISAHGSIPGGVLLWSESDSRAWYLASLMTSTPKSVKDVWVNCCPSREKLLLVGLLIEETGRAEWDRSSEDLQYLVAWAKELESNSSTHDWIRETLTELGSLQNELALQRPWLAQQKPPQALGDYVRACTIRLQILRCVQTTTFRLEPLTTYHSGVFLLPSLPYRPRFPGDSSDPMATTVGSNP